MARTRNGRPASGREGLLQDLVTLQPRLKVYALSLTRNREQAEDLLQEVLLKSISHLDSFQVGTNLAAWTFRIMRNEFVSGLRRRKNLVSIDGLENMLKLSTQSETESVLDFRTMLLYLACIERNQSDAIIAAGYVGMSYETAAEGFGCSVGTIKSRVSRGRDALALLMHETAVERVDITWFKNATRGIPKNHFYYPIAKAYEDLYAAVEGVGDGGDVSSAPTVPESEKLWNELVASGALDEDQEDLSALMQGQ